MKKRILIVDDEPDLAELIADNFINAGWETCIAQNGKIGMAKVAEFRPDVIFSDITMPVMDGMQFLEALDKDLCEIPLVFVTGFRDVEKMKKAWGLCAFDFLDKPFNEVAMIQVAENAFDHGREYVRSARKRYLKLNKAS